MDQRAKLLAHMEAHKKTRITCYICPNDYSFLREDIVKSDTTSVTYFCVTCSYSVMYYKKPGEVGFTRRVYNG
jgi:hypothetical protein